MTDPKTASTDDGSDAMSVESANPPNSSLQRASKKTGDKVEKTFMVKICFKEVNNPKHDKTSSNANKNDDEQPPANEKHINLIEALLRAFPTIKIFSQDKKQITNTNEHTLSYYAKVFHVNKVLDKNDNLVEETIIHQIKFPGTLKTLRNNKIVKKELQKYNASITHHLWTKFQWKIDKLGFLTFVHPVHNFASSVYETLKTSMQDANPNTKIPAFKLSIASPTAPDDRKLHTKTYEIQCERHNRSNVLSFLDSIDEKTQYTFIRHSWRRGEMATTYRNAIHTQNEYLSNYSIILIYDISTQAMKILQPQILKNPMITAVTPHIIKHVHTNNRWNIHTNKNNFNTCDKFWKIDSSHESVLLCRVTFGSVQTNRWFIDY